MPLLNVNQINPTQFALAVQQYASGASFSGNLVAYLGASGWIGPLAVTITGSQVITGLKTFLDSPRVPYSGNTGTAPSARWVNDQISAAVSAPINALSGYVQGASGALSYVRVTGSSTIQAANFTGLGGTQIIYSGNQIFVSGAAGGGGAGTGSNVSVTGSAALSSVNLTGAGSVVVTYVVETGPGAPDPYVLISGSSSAGDGAPDSVTTTGTYIMAGTYTFSGSPFVPAPTQPSGAANLSWVSGVSGDLYARVTGISGALATQGGGTTNNFYITGTGVVAASSTGNVTNTFNITSGAAVVSSSGTVTNTFNGTVNNTIAINQPTGNYVNMSYYFDEFSLGTGLNQVETFVGRSFVFTGWAVGTITTGTQGFFSGALYQRTTTNAKTSFVNISLNSGAFFTGAGGFNQEISGLNRVGLDIYRIGTGLTGLSIGLFGVGY